MVQLMVHINRLIRNRSSFHRNRLRCFSLLLPRFLPSNDDRKGPSSNGCSKQLDSNMCFFLPFVPIAVQSSPTHQYHPHPRAWLLSGFCFRYRCVRVWRTLARAADDAASGVNVCVSLRLIYLPPPPPFPSSSFPFSFGHPKAQVVCIFRVRNRP